MSDRFTAGYALGIDANGRNYIVCNRCSSRSYHPEDISEKFCAYCDRFLEPGSAELIALEDFHDRMEWRCARLRSLRRAARILAWTVAPLSGLTAGYFAASLAWWPSGLIALSGFALSAGAFEFARRRSAAVHAELKREHAALLARLWDSRGWSIEPDVGA